MDIKQEKPLTEKTEKPHPLSAMPKSKHIVVDTEACGGCLTCEFACSARHFEGYAMRIIPQFRLVRICWIIILMRLYAGSAGLLLVWLYVKKAL